MSNRILADGRWSGSFGIGRFSSEILTRLTHTDILYDGPKPLSLRGLLWQARQIHCHRRSHRIFFTPGFNPVFTTDMPYVLTLCDLIYLNTPGLKGLAKKIFLNVLVKRSLKNAFKVLTISNYSKRVIQAWADIPADKIINVGCGISDIFHPEGEKFDPGFSYILHVGNTNAHKNIPRLLIGFANAKLDGIKLILTGQPTQELHQIIKHHSLTNRIVFSHHLSELELATYYRGAKALVLPSLYEGFGLPILEAMACGIPVLTSNTTSCPEVAGDAALLVNPYDVDAIQEGIEKMMNDQALRKSLVLKGFQRLPHYSWEKTAGIIQGVLDKGDDELSSNSS